MLAVAMTVGFLAIAVLIAVSLKASLAQGMAAMAALRREGAACETDRMVTVRSYSTSAPSRAAAIAAVSGRPSRRAASSTGQPQRERRLAAA